MLQVITPEEVLNLIKEEFKTIEGSSENISIEQCVGRILAADITASEYVPDFDRSLVDGYALRAKDTFGCSDSIPAVLKIDGEVLMGKPADFTVSADSCGIIPTGGAVPEGADAVQMLEYAEEYGDGTVGIMKPAAPGAHMIFRGDDVFPGKTVLHKGRVLRAMDIGALAAMGITKIPVRPLLRIGIISTGDEIIPYQEKPMPGQIRDVNTALLHSAVSSPCTLVKEYGIVRDQEEILLSAVRSAMAENDLILISGGSSAGEKDATAKVIDTLGELLVHGIAMKPGKPTIIGKADETVLFGLPGHPVAAFFVTQLFVLPLIDRLCGCSSQYKESIPAELTENISANDGRAQYLAVRLGTEEQKMLVTPIRTKSGLISSLAEADGYISISRDCEGMAAGTTVNVFLFR